MIDFIKRHDGALQLVILLMFAFMFGKLWAQSETTEALRMAADSSHYWHEALEDLRECRIDSLRYRHTYRP